jgi:hypothetical protein
MTKKITCLEIELALKRMFDPRRQLVVPNVSWGAGLHECDLLVISKAGYATEVEIKTNMQDLKRDSKKSHLHLHPKLRALYYALTADMIDRHSALDHIPETAGVIKMYRASDGNEAAAGRVCAFTIREAVETDANKWSPQEVAEIYRLGALRIWTLKEKVLKLRNEVEDWRTQLEVRG